MAKLTALLLFPGFTALDAVGPYHALAMLPGYEFQFVAENPGPMSDGGRLTLNAQLGIDDVDHADILIVPGGLAAIAMARTGHSLIEWIRRIHPTTEWTTSVCTGSLMLAAAGVLTGLPATSHWYCHRELADFGAIPTDERVVRAGKVITAAGVSAGIDMSLILTEIVAGTEWAQGVQLDMEYAPEPPFDSGHPTSAPAEVTEMLQAMYDQVLNAS